MAKSASQIPEGASNTICNIRVLFGPAGTFKERFLFVSFKLLEFLPAATRFPVAPCGARDEFVTKQTDTDRVSQEEPCSGGIVAWYFTLR